MSILKDFGYTPISDLVFKPDGRPRYKIGKIPLIGTTTVLGVRDKPFLMWWTTKENYKYMKSNWDLKKTYTSKEKEELLMAAKKAWTKKRDKALDSGKITHGLVQKSILESKRFKVEKIIHSDETCQKEIRSAYQAFLDWEARHTVKYYATELCMGSEKTYTGGTVDVVAEIDGWLEVIDWKTSKILSEDAFLQMANYKAMLIEGGVDPKIGRRVVKLSKDDSGFKEIKIKSDFNRDYKVFLGLLETYRWNRDIKKDFKDKYGNLRLDK